MHGIKQLVPLRCQTNSATSGCDKSQLFWLIIDWNISISPVQCHFSEYVATEVTLDLIIKKDFKPATYCILLSLA